VYVAARVLRVIAELWRFNETLDASLADSEIEHFADLARRNLGVKRR
jgi:hypothetical protein